MNFISRVLFLICVLILSLNSTVFGKVVFLGAAIFLETAFLWEGQGYKTRKLTLLIKLLLLHPVGCLYYYSTPCIHAHCAFGSHSRHGSPIGDARYLVFDFSQHCKIGCNHFLQGNCRIVTVAPCLKGRYGVVNYAKKAGSEKNEHEFSSTSLSHSYLSSAFPLQTPLTVTRFLACFAMNFH